MRSRTVSPLSVWAVLVMEAGLVLPLISLPTQGDRLPGILGPLLLVAMLPLGYLTVCQIPALHDPSWRLLCGISIALVTRGFLSSVPEPGPTGLALWLARNVVPTAIGVGLWWRGGGLAASELTATEIRREFGVLAVCLLLALALARPFLLLDPLLLGASVASFAAGGLVATALSRQDAAQAASLRLGRTLAITTALLPAVAAVFLVGALRPALVGGIWSTLARIIELLLAPIGWLLNWLASFLPARAPGPPVPLPRPNQLRLPDPETVAELQNRMGWVGELVLVVLLLAASIGMLLVVRLMLGNWLNPPVTSSTRDKPAALTTESSGTPGEDAHALLRWVKRWLMGRLRRRAASTRQAGSPADVAAADAWAAYKRLLEWADDQGQARRPAETTGQLQTRLAAHAPEAAQAVDLVTTTYEWERYGAVHPEVGRLRRVQAALRALVDR